MASFEPSPRESKRRRTGSYATRRTTLSTSPSVRTNERRGASQISAKQNGTETDVPLSVLSNAGEEPGPVATDAITEEAAGATASRRSSGRRKRTTEAASEGLNSVPQGKLTEKTRMAATGRDGAAEPPQEVDEGEDEIQPRSSGRTRRPPRRFVSPSTELPKETPGLEKRSTEKVKSKAKQTRALTSEAANNIQYPQPKGILTPSRHGRERRAGPRKSVVFENDEKQIEEQLGFRDIDSSTKKEKKRVTETKPQRRSKDGTPEQSDGREGSDDEIDAAAVAQLAIGEVSVEDDEDEELLLEETPVLDDILPPTPLADSTKTPTTTNDDPHLTTIKLEVLNRMTSHSLSPISHLDTQYTTVHSLLNATITAGESNSLLLLGSRGAGKSLLISHTLSELRKSHGDDFHIVRLNGFFQTDDKLALREIWRQLGHEMAVPEAETGEVSSYADTMASLLSLLSHPEELDDPEGMALDHPNTEQQNKMSKSVIFILDEFDLFTTHPRQTLLYNLFDIAQAKKAPIAVVGCSTRMDVVECLEKRVKSRFSHRWLHVPGMKSVSAFEEAVASVLCLPMEGKEGLGLGEEELKWRRRWNRSIKVSSKLYLSLLEREMLGVLTSNSLDPTPSCSNNPSCPEENFLQHEVSSGLAHGIVCSRRDNIRIFR